MGPHNGLWPLCHHKQIYPDYAEHICPLCHVQELDLSLPEHVLSCHTNSKGTWDDLMGTLLTMDPSFFSHILNIYFPLFIVHCICMYTFSLTLVVFDFNFNFFICMLYLTFLLFTAYVIDYVACAFLFDYLLITCSGEVYGILLRERRSLSR